MKGKNKLQVFQGERIRKKWHNGEWWFSVVDIIEILTGSSIPKRYWSDLKIRLKEEGSEVYEKIVRLKLMASDGKMRETDCANTETAFRIIQSIPSPRAEPMKLWLAQVGYERVEEIQDPELAQGRVKKYYELKGYPKAWIEKRLRGIAIRQELTDEWKSRGVGQETDFAILTNEITKATFGKTVKEYKEYKGIDKQKKNLRDNMTDWELILTMVGEKATTDITSAKDAKGFDECKETAKEGGEIASNTRKEIEQKTGKKIVSKDNFKNLTAKRKPKSLKEK